MTADADLSDSGVDGDPAGDPVLHPTGDLDARTAAALETEVLRVVGAAGRVVLDLRQVRFVDSTGLGALIAVNTRARQQGLALVLRNPPSQLLRLMAITQTYGEFRWG